MKFYHTSDIHLGAVPDGCFPWSKARGEEIYDSFVRLVDQANLEKIDLLLISGDLFHRQPLTRELQVVGRASGFPEKNSDGLHRRKPAIISGRTAATGPSVFRKMCISSMGFRIRRLFFQSFRPWFTA